MMSKWEMVRLGEIADVGAGQGAPQGEQYYSDTGIPFIKAGHMLSLISGTKESELKKIEADTAKAHNLKVFFKDTIIFAKSGMSCLKGYVYQLQNNCYVVNHLACVKSRYDKAHPAYLKYHLVFSPPNRLIKDDSYPSISLRDISNITIPLPPLPTQQQIADVLDRASALIEKRKAQIEKLDLLVKSQFIEMFGDPVTNPKGWDKAPLRSIISNANNGMSRRGNDNTGNIVLRLVELQDGFIDYEMPNRILLTNAEKKRYLLRENDFLFARVNGNPEYVGRCAVFHNMGEDVYHNDHIIRVHFDEARIEGNFASALLNSVYGKRQMKSQIKTSAGQYTISQEGIGAIEVVLPPFYLQRQFADFVGKVETQKSLLQQSLAKLELNYKSLIQKCFKGEIFNG